MPPDIEALIKVVAEGALLKIGDVALINAPALIKKGGALIIVIWARKRTGGKKRENPRAGR